MFVPIFPNSVVLHISYFVYLRFAPATFTAGSCVSAPISFVLSSCLAVSQRIVTQRIFKTICFSTYIFVVHNKQTSHENLNALLRPS